MFYLITYFFPFLIYMPRIFAVLTFRPCRLDIGEEGLRSHQLAPNIRSFAQLNDETIAVGDMDGNVFLYNIDTYEKRLAFNKGSRAYTINKDGNGRLWIGTRGGGVWISEGTSAEHIDNLPARQIYDIHFAHDGTTWIATLDGGLIEGHQQEDGSYSFVQHLVGERIHELDIDLNGRLWIATENGILRKDGAKTDTIFNGGKVVCICHSRGGTVWAGSNGYGLIKISDNSISFIQADNGLANNCVESVVCDNEGNVIAGTCRQPTKRRRGESGSRKDDTRE